jgi:hypothetical protein
LAQVAATKISNTHNITVLIETLKEILEEEFKEIEEKKKNLKLVYACILTIGSLLLSSFSSSNELIQMILAIFNFLIEKAPLRASQHEIYKCCHVITNLFKKLFSLFPTLKEHMVNDLNEMLNKVINERKLELTHGHKLFLDILAMLGTHAPIDSLKDFFVRLPTELLFQYLLKSGNIFQFESKKLKELILGNSAILIGDVESDVYMKNYNKILEIFNCLNQNDLSDILEFLLKLATKTNNTNQFSTIIRLSSLLIISIHSGSLDRSQHIEKYFGWVLDLTKHINQTDFETKLKCWFSISLEFTKINGADFINLEKSILEVLIKQKDLSKEIGFWIIKKAMTNHCYLISNTLLKQIENSVADEKVKLYLQTLKFISDDCLTSNSKRRSEFMRKKSFLIHHRIVE